MKKAKRPYDPPRITHSYGEKELRELMSPHASLPDYASL